MAISRTISRNLSLNSMLPVSSWAWFSCYDWYDVFLQSWYTVICSQSGTLFVLKMKSSICALCVRLSVPKVQTHSDSAFALRSRQPENTLCHTIWSYSGQGRILFPCLASQVLGIEGCPTSLGLYQAFSSSSLHWFQHLASQVLGLEGCSTSLGFPFSPMRWF